MARFSTSGELTSGELTSGELTSGELTSGELTSGELTRGDPRPERLDRGRPDHDPAQPDRIQQHDLGLVAEAETGEQRPRLAANRPGHDSLPRDGHGPVQR